MTLSLLLGLSALSLFVSGSHLTAAIQLMECIGSRCSIPTNGDPFGAFWAYFNSLFPLVVGTAAGITLLWALFGGIEIMSAGSDTAKVTSGKNRLLHATFGLLLLAFSSLILYMLNPTFYK